MQYEDHIRLWAGELRDWLPDRLFDAHVHLTPPDLIAPFSAERRKQPLCTFPGFTWEELQAIYPRLYSGKTVAGLIAFPLPMQEVKLEPANEYIADVMKRAPHVKGFILSHPTDFERTRAVFESALAHGVRFRGVKPYFDLLGKSNYATTMPEFIPDALLEFMDHERLVMMLHTSGLGMCLPDNQNYLRTVAERHPNIKIILAHMGRYLQVEDFYAFFDSGFLELPSFFLEMSSASRPEVYERTLSDEKLRDRLLFGSDCPFGLITGIEQWSPQSGPTFITRDAYPWSHPTQAPSGHTDLTCNTYHTIKALKDALASLPLDPPAAGAIKQKIFHDNATTLFR